MPSVPRMLHQGLAADKPTADATLNQGWLYYETDTDTLRQSWNGTWVVISSGSSLPTVSDQLAADVALTLANTYYDGPSVNLTAGTWLLTGSVNAYNPSVGVYLEARLWDGITTAASGEIVARNAYDSGRISLAAIVTVTGPTTYKISMAASAGGSVMQAAQLNNASGNTIATLVGVKVA